MNAEDWKLWAGFAQAALGAAIRERGITDPAIDEDLAGLAACFADLMIVQVEIRKAAERWDARTRSD